MEPVSTNQLATKAIQNKELMFFHLVDLQLWIRMKQAKPKTSRDQAHTPKSPKGLGDFYGTGIRAKIGRMREGMGMQEVTPKQLKTPPKSLA